MRINHHIPLRPGSFLNLGTDKTDKTTNANTNVATTAGVTKNPIGPFVSGPEIQKPTIGFTSGPEIAPTTVKFDSRPEIPNATVNQVATQNLAASQSTPLDAQKALSLASQTSQQLLAQFGSGSKSPSFGPNPDSVLGLLQM